jgi:hypothetical protein
MLCSVNADRSRQQPERVGTLSSYSATSPISTQPAKCDSGLLRPWRAHGDAAGSQDEAGAADAAGRRTATSRAETRSWKFSSVLQSLTLSHPGAGRKWMRAAEDDIDPLPAMRSAAAHSSPSSHCRERAEPTRSGVRCESAFATRQLRAAGLIFWNKIS